MFGKGLSKFILGLKCKYTTPISNCLYVCMSVATRSQIDFKSSKKITSRLRSERFLLRTHLLIFLLFIIIFFFRDSLWFCIVRFCSKDKSYTRVTYVLYTYILCGNHINKFYEKWKKNWVEKLYLNLLFDHKYMKNAIFKIFKNLFLFFEVKPQNKI